MSELERVKCRFCGTTLFRTDVNRGRVEIVCYRRECRSLQTIQLTRVARPTGRA